MEKSANSFRYLEALVSIANTHRRGRLPSPVPYDDLSAASTACATTSAAATTEFAEPGPNARIAAPERPAGFLSPDIALPSWAQLAASAIVGAPISRFLPAEVW